MHLVYASVNLLAPCSSLLVTPHITSTVPRIAYNQINQRHNFLEYAFGPCGLRNSSLLVLVLAFYHGRYTNHIFN